MKQLLKVLELKKIKSTTSIVKLITDENTTKQQRVLIAVDNRAEVLSLVKHLVSKLGDLAVVNPNAENEIFYNGYHFIDVKCKEMANLSLYKLVNDPYTLKVRMF